MHTLPELISTITPANSDWKSLHIQSTPKESHNIIISKSNIDKPTTIKIEHFITLSFQNVIVLGLEVHVYITLFKDRTDHHLFVSKADTTGIFPQCELNVKMSDLIKVILEFLINYPVENYCNCYIPRKNNKNKSSSSYEGTTTISALKYIINQIRTNENYQLQSKPSTTKIIPKTPIVIKISLFTRPDNQYLFPQSFKNINKHVLSGDKLLKWWIRLIDDVISNIQPKKTSCKLIIPGSDEKSIIRFLPDSKYWTVGDIFQSDNDKAIYNIPLFPDDPKGRFLEHLVVENRSKSVNLDQFWVELSIRQEFRLGIIVGVIGVELELSTTDPDTESIVTGKVLNKSKFKKVKNLILGEDYSNRDDILELNDNLISLDDELFTHIAGTRKKLSKHISGKSNQDNGQVNDLTSMVKRKEPKINELIPRKNNRQSIPKVNDLTSIIKRKKIQ